MHDEQAFYKRKLHNLESSRCARRRGSVVLVVLGALLFCMGFCAIAVDYGTSVVIKNKLQRTCEAAALAGAVELLKNSDDNINYTQARYQARLAAYNNGITITDSDITFPTNRRIRVGSVQTRNFFFGGAIGIPTGRVSAAATAGRDYVRAITGALPLGITQATYFHYRPTAAKPNPQTVDLLLTRNTQEKFGPLNSDTILGNTTFNAVALDLRGANSGNSGALFEADLTNGTNSQTIIQQQIDPLGSSITSQGSNLKQAIDERIARAAAAPWYDTGKNYQYPNYPAGDPRVVFILVGANGYEANNSNPKLDLAYFAPAYIDGPVTFTRGSNPQAIVPLKFMPATGLSSTTTGISVDESGNDTGLTAVRLLD